MQSERPNSPNSQIVEETNFRLSVPRTEVSSGQADNSISMQPQGLPDVDLTERLMLSSENPASEEVKEGPSEH